MTGPARQQALDRSRRRSDANKPALGTGVPPDERRLRVGELRLLPLPSRLQVSRPRSRVQEMTARRLWLSLLMFFAGEALVAAAALAPNPSDAAGVRQGGTLRLSTFSDVDYVDPALAATSFSWPITFATCAMLFAYPDEPGAAGTRVVPEVVRGFHRLARRQDLHVRPEADLPLPHGHAGDRAELCGRDRANRRSEDEVTRRRLPRRDRRRERLRQREGALDLRRSRPRPLPAADPPDRAARRLHGAADDAYFCPVLPTTPVDRKGVDDPPGSGPYYVAERVLNRRIVLRRNAHYGGRRPAHVDKVVWTIGESLDAFHPADRAEPDRPLRRPRSCPARSTRPWSGSTASNRPRRSVLRHAEPVDLVPRAEPRSAGVQGARIARSRSRRQSITRSTGPR